MDALRLRRSQRRISEPEAAILADTPRVDLALCREGKRETVTTRYPFNLQFIQFMQHSRRNESI